MSDGAVSDGDGTTPTAKPTPPLPTPMHFAALFAALSLPGYAPCLRCGAAARKSVVPLCGDCVTVLDEHLTNGKFLG